MVRIDDEELMCLSQLVHVRIKGDGPGMAEEGLRAAVQDHDERYGGADLVADWSINPVRPVAGGMLAHVPRLP